MMAGKKQAPLSLGAFVMLVITGVAKLTGAFDDVQLEELKVSGAEIVDTFMLLTGLLVAFSTNVLHALGSTFPKLREPIKKIPFFEVDFTDVERKEDGDGI